LTAVFPNKHRIRKELAVVRRIPARDARHKTLSAVSKISLGQPSSGRNGKSQGLKIVGLHVLLKNSDFGWRSASTAAIRPFSSVRALGPEVIMELLLLLRIFSET
jgi:hypothetical protein